MTAPSRDPSFAGPMPAAQPMTAPPPPPRRSRRPARAAAWLTLMLLLGSASVQAETITVTTNADSGTGSLRAAITAANASSAASTITFDAATDGHPIVLASALPDLLSAGGNLSIEGNGAANTIIDGADQVRLFHVYFQDNLALAFKDLMLRNGMADQEQGAAVYIAGVNSSLTFERVAVVDNFGTWNGGAVYTEVPTTVTDSTFRGNGGNTQGAAMEVNGSTLDARNVSFVQNDAGAAVSVLQLGYSSTPSRMVNVTMQTGDTSTAIRVHGNAELAMINCLIVPSPTYGGGNLLYQASGGSFDVANSWNNVIGEAGNSGFVDGENGNQVGSVVAPLGPVGDYGGPTWTAPLLPGNVALDAGVAPSSSHPDVPATDQRGQARIGPVDVGAFESHGFQISKVSGDNQSAETGDLFADPLVVAVTANDPSEPVEGGEVVFTAPATGASALLSSGTLNAAGQTQTIALANTVAGGPYTVSAGIPVAGSVSFSLTNLPSVCSSFVFPYTLTGSDNATRVANLRQAIECANEDGDANIIDLDGQVLVFNDGPYEADGHGPTALPIVSAPLTLTNGELERDLNAPAFRLLQFAATTPTSDPYSGIVDNLTVRNGSASDFGGGMLVLSNVLIRHSQLHNNHAAISGGAIGTAGSSQIVVVYDSDLSGNTATSGAAFDGAGFYLLSSHVTGNGGASSDSIVRASAGVFLISTVVAGNTAGAGALLQLGSSGSGMLAVSATIADNSVAGELFSAPAGASTLGANTIIWGNQYASLGAFSIEHSIVQEPVPGDGNLNQAPGFVDAAAGDYRLVDGSPAIDAGVNTYALQDMPDADQDGDTSEWLPDAAGQPRRADDTGVMDTGTGTPPVIDMGALERQTPSAAAHISVAAGTSMMTGEDGSTDSFTVVLDRYPAADVVVPVTSSNNAEGTVSPASLTFTHDNWNQPQTVTITGVDDGALDGDVPYSIYLGPAASTDLLYSGMAPPPIAVVNQDNELAAFQVGGTVTGLLGSNLSLTILPSNESLPIAANGNFVFPTPLATGTSYTVSIATQPGSPAQTCHVVNGNGSVANTDITNVVVNCGAANTYTVGGTASGLDSGQSVTLQLNGGGDLLLTGNGPFVFVPRLTDGASYVVTITTQPVTQLCTLSQAAGQVAGSDVDNITLSCAPRAAEWTLSVDDGSEYARYGHLRDYVVTLSNTGNISDTIAVAASFTPAYDLPNMHWQCLADAGSTGCTAQGSNSFFDVVTVQPDTSVTWIISAPILGHSQETDATVTLSSPPPAKAAGSARVLAPPTPVSDTDTLVIFRDGVDLPYADGAQRPAAALAPQGSTVLSVEPGQMNGIHALECANHDGARLCVQQLSLQARSFVRLLDTGHDGRQSASPWAAAEPAAPLVLGQVAQHNERVWLLEGAARPLQLGTTTATGTATRPLEDSQ